MREIPSEPNPDLLVGANNQAPYNQPDRRRHSYHNFSRIARYGTSYRAARVMSLTKSSDARIAEMDAVRRLTSAPSFSGMAVIRGSEVLFERYAADFGPDCPHSVQSVSKMMTNLVVGRLVEDGKIDLAREVGEYLPWIGSGYADATVQQVLDMDVANDYFADCRDPHTTTYENEEVWGWRLPADPANEKTVRSVLATIASEDTTNRTGVMDYKCANTEVLGMISETVSGRPMRAFLAEIADAAGIAGCLHMTTDREGFPTMSGGMSITARDLVRLGSIFVRRGRGIDGREVGSASFIESTLSGGIPTSKEQNSRRYSNQTNTDGRWLGHGGFGGQFMLADLTSGVVGAYFSVIETTFGTTEDYAPAYIAMLSEIGRLEFEA